MITQLCSKADHLLDKGPCFNNFPYHNFVIYTQNLYSSQVRQNLYIQQGNSLKSHKIRRIEFLLVLTIWDALRSKLHEYMHIFRRKNHLISFLVLYRHFNNSTGSSQNSLCNTEVNFLFTSQFGDTAGESYSKCLDGRERVPAM